jgi:transcriptional regulator with XRE-family HTH domain
MPNEHRTSSVGPLLKRLRIAKQISLRDLAERLELDPGNYSRVERGVFAPPPRAKLDEILQLLEVDEPNREGILDTADIERGSLPTDLQQDEVLVRELPVLFRAVRKGDREALDQFIEAVRKGGGKK